MPPLLQQQPLSAPLRPAAGRQGQRLELHHAQQGAEEAAALAQGLPADMHPQGRLPARAAQQVRGALQDVLPVQRCAPAARRRPRAPPRGAAAHGAGLRRCIRHPVPQPRDDHRPDARDEGLQAQAQEGAPPHPRRRPAPRLLTLGAVPLRPRRRCGRISTRPPRRCGTRSRATRWTTSSRSASRRSWTPCATWTTRSA